MSVWFVTHEPCTHVTQLRVFYSVSKVDCTHVAQKGAAFGFVTHDACNQVAQSVYTLSECVVWGPPQTVYKFIRAQATGSLHTYWVYIHVTLNSLFNYLLLFIFSYFLSLRQLEVYKAVELTCWRYCIVHTP